MENDELGSVPIQVCTDIPMSVIIRDLVHQDWRNYDLLLDFVKSLDEEAADWDFTEKLYKHFKGEMKKLRKAEKELRAKYE